MPYFSALGDAFCFPKGQLNTGQAENGAPRSGQEATERGMCCFPTAARGPDFSAEDGAFCFTKGELSTGQAEKRGSAQRSGSDRGRIVLLPDHCAGRRFFCSGWRFLRVKET